MRRSAVRDRRALLVDKVLLWIALIGFLIATALYLFKEAGRDRREK
jgi:hypothetical protein